MDVESLLYAWLTSTVHPDPPSWSPIKKALAYAGRGRRCITSWSRCFTLCVGGSPEIALLQDLTAERVKELEGSRAISSDKGLYHSSNRSTLDRKFSMMLVTDLPNTTMFRSADSRRRGSRASLSADWATTKASRARRRTRGLSLKGVTFT